jgi:hypothetical protein
VNRTCGRVVVVGGETSWEEPVREDRPERSVGNPEGGPKRESMLMSKAELARQANVSPITITRIEKNMPCRIATQRKILLALGLKPADKHKIFKD